LRKICWDIEKKSPYNVYKVLGYVGPKLYFLRLPKENKTEDERLKQSHEDFSKKQGKIQAVLFDYLKWLEIRPDMEVDIESGLPDMTVTTYIL
jgi:hypothetical protein